MVVNIIERTVGHFVEETMTEGSTDDLEVVAEMKRRARATWAAGNYDIAADGIWPVGATIVGAAQVRPGERVLDIACAPETPQFRPPRLARR